MSDPSDTGLWVGAGGVSLAGILLLLKQWGPAILRALGKAATVKEAPAPQPHGPYAYAPPWPPHDRRSTPKDFHQVGEIKILNERINQLTTTTLKLADVVNEVERHQREMHGNFVTAINALRMQQGMIQASIDRNSSTNEKLVEVLADLAKNRR